MMEKPQSHYDPATVAANQWEGLVRFINQNSQGGGGVTNQSVRAMDPAGRADWLARYRASKR